MTKTRLAFVLTVLVALFLGCDPPTTDDMQADEQAQALAQAHAQIGMPAVTHFAEKHEAKDIYEMRDKSLPTHSYIVNEMNGCLLYLGTSVGFGLPYATQYTSPTRSKYRNNGYYQVPQAEPNGLFMPSSAEGTSIMLKGPDDNVQPVYVEPRVLVSPFRLPNLECKTASATATAASPTAPVPAPAASTPKK